MIQVKPQQLGKAFFLPKHVGARNPGILPIQEGGPANVDTALSGSTVKRLPCPNWD